MDGRRAAARVDFISGTTEKEGEPTATQGTVNSFCKMDREPPRQGSVDGNHSVLIECLQPFPSYEHEIGGLSRRIQNFI